MAAFWSDIGPPSADRDAGPQGAPCGSPLKSLSVNIFPSRIFPFAVDFRMQMLDATYWT